MFSKAALSNVTVLDLTRVLAGPFCSMMFADMGANVIKIENPKEGADERKMGPFQNGESALSVGYQRALSDRATLTIGGAFSGDEKSVGVGAGFGW